MVNRQSAFSHGRRSSRAAGPVGEFVVRHCAWWVALALIVSVLAVYWQVRGFDFVNYDDPDYVYENPVIKNGVSVKGLVEVFTHGHFQLWLPITSFTYMLGCDLYGVSAAGHHLTSLLFHLVNVLLLFTVLRRLTGAIWPSAFVAAVFAVHPLNAESVAWVSGRKELVYTLFWLLGLWAYGRYARQPNVKRYVSVLICHGLGLAAKTSQMTFPFVLLLLDYWPLRRCRPQDADDSHTRKRILWLIIEKLPLVALAAPAGLSAYLMTERSGGMESLEAVPLATRIPNTIWVYGFYVEKLFWPSGLALHYPYPSSPLPRWQVAAALVALVAVSSAVLLLVRKHPYLAVGWFWFLVTLFPVSGFFRATKFLMADRYAYVPLIGLFILLAWGGAAIAAHAPRMKRPLAACAAVYALAMGLCGTVQTSYWQNSFVLFRHVIDVNPRNALAYKNLGTAFASARQYEQARAQYLKGIEITPDDSELHASLGGALTKMGRIGDAIEEYRKAVAISPDLAAAQYGLGNLLAKQRKYEEAMAAYSEALRVEPEHRDATLNMGSALASLGRFDEAAVFFLKALEFRPNDADACVNLGHLYTKQHRLDDAVAYYKKALELDPRRADAQRGLDEALRGLDGAEGARSSRPAS